MDYGDLVTGRHSYSDLNNGLLEIWLLVSVLKDCCLFIAGQNTWDATIRIVRHELCGLVPGQPGSCPMTHNWSFHALDVSSLFRHDVELRPWCQIERCGTRSPDHFLGVAATNKNRTDIAMKTLIFCNPPNPQDQSQV